MTPTVARIARPRRRLWYVAALLGGLLLASDGDAQQRRGPIQLFPNLDQPSGEAGERAFPRPGDPGTVTTPPGTEAPRAFQVEGLEAPAVDAIGLAEEGLDPGIWRGSDGDRVLMLLASLPVAVDNPPLRDLTRRLLVTGGAVEGSFDVGRLLEARVERLLAMGDLASAAALLEQLPPSSSDSGLLRLAAEVALWSGNHERACALADDVASGSAAAFWQQLVVVCRLREGDADGAALALDLLREAEEAPDQSFFRLADMVANDELRAGSVPVAQPMAPEVALLRIAEVPLPETALRSPSPILLAAIARTPSLVPGQELHYAEMAFQAGALSTQELTALYLEHAAETGEADLLRLIDTAWGPETRALALQRLLDEPSAVVRAEILDALWRRAGGSEWFLVAMAFVRPLTELPVDPALLFAAESMAAALLAAEQGVAAARWLNLLQANSATSRDAETGVARVAPLFALAGFGGSQQVPEPDPATLAAWRGSVEAAADKAALLYALLEGVGARVPESAWWEVADRPAQPAALPPVAYWRSLARAQAENRRGDVVLLALHMLGGDPAAAHPEAVIAALGGLRRTGLDRAARDVAVAAALLEDL